MQEIIEKGAEQPVAEPASGLGRRGSGLAHHLRARWPAAMRRPCRVRSGSTNSMVVVSGATMVASPPVPHDLGAPATGPFLHDPLHDAIHGIGRAEQNSGANTVFGTTSDDSLRRCQLGCRELGRATGELVR